MSSLDPIEAYPVVFGSDQGPFSISIPACLS